ncbi:MAG: hypothetical protein MPJ78_05010 [Hyphomicrobiaceae bacterium]|nr:hypothetical protein [Hyphomicrobiaceae bacterium]
MRKGTKFALVASVFAIAGAAGLSSMAIADSRGSHGGGHHGMGKHADGHHGKWHKRGKRGKKSMYRMIARFDTNDDGKLTQEEVDTTRKDLHAKNDTNKDGKLNLEEFETLWVDFTNRRMVRGFQRIDVNGDAVITLEEYLEPFKNTVARRDRNDDNVLDANDRKGKKHRGRGAGRMMERFDANEDGKLTQEEIDEVRKKAFAKHDANKDGKLDLAEFKTRWIEFTQPRMVRSFQYIDRDGDAVITVKEYLKPFSTVVARMDRNEDGVLDKDDRKRGRHKGSDGEKK